MISTRNRNAACSLCFPLAQTFEFVCPCVYLNCPVPETRGDWHAVQTYTNMPIAQRYESAGADLPPDWSARIEERNSESFDRYSGTCQPRNARAFDTQRAGRFVSETVSSLIIRDRRLPHWNCSAQGARMTNRTILSRQQQLIIGHLDIFRAEFSRPSAIEIIHGREISFPFNLRTTCNSGSGSSRH